MAWIDGVKTLWRRARTPSAGSVSVSRMTDEQLLAAWADNESPRLQNVTDKELYDEMWRRGFGYLASV